MSAKFSTPPWVLYAILIVAIAVFPAIAPNKYYITIANDILILAVAGVGLNLLLGLSGQISLGHVGFLATGAYASAIASSRFDIPIFATIPIALVVAGLVGTPMGLLALRVRSHYLAMATLAFGFIVVVIAQRWIGLTGGSMGISGVPRLNWGDFRAGAQNFFWTAGLIFVIVQILSDYIICSHFGRKLRAIKESESLAATIGTNPSVWRAGIFIFSAMLAGLSGALFAHQSGFVSSDAFTLDQSIMLLVVVVLGGLGHRYAAIFGAIFLIILEQMIAGLYEYSTAIFGALLLIVVLFMPDGLAGLVSNKIFRRKQHTPAPANTKMAKRIFPASIIPSVESDAENILELNQITKNYEALVALNDVSIKVKSGTIHALIGPNGAGKSTLINIISGLYGPNQGSITLNGEDVTKVPAQERARRGLVRTFQNLQLIDDLTILENVILGMPEKNSLATNFWRWLTGKGFEADQRKEAMLLLDFFGIARYTDEYPSALSYGHRKMVELARALGQKPRLLLLDEPVAGINEEETEEIAVVIKKLRELGITILLVEHDMSFVMKISDSVSVLDYGNKISEGSPDHVKSDPSVIVAYLGEEADND